MIGYIRPCTSRSGHHTTHAAGPGLAISSHHTSRAASARVAALERGESAGHWYNSERGLEFFTFRISGASFKAHVHVWSDGIELNE